MQLTIHLLSHEIVEVLIYLMVTAAVLIFMGHAAAGEQVSYFIRSVIELHTVVCENFIVGNFITHKMAKIYYTKIL